MDKPIDMILYCPRCNHQHVDKPDEPAKDFSYQIVDGVKYPLNEAPKLTPHWTNPPHRSHLCEMCGHIWRPADVPTNGVEKLQTQGKNDSKLDGVFMPLPNTLRFQDAQSCVDCGASLSLARRKLALTQCPSCLPDVTERTTKTITYTAHEASMMLFTVETLLPKHNTLRLFIERIMK